MGLGALEGSCLPGARVLGWWEDDGAPPVAPGDCDTLIVRALRALERVRPVLRAPTRQRLEAAAGWARPTLAHPQHAVAPELVQPMLEDLATLIALAVEDAARTDPREAAVLHGLLPELTAAAQGEIRGDEASA